MIQISFHSYQLKPLNALNAVTAASARSGALLKVEWEGLGIGYSDLHPWPEFGDASLEQQLENMRNKKFSTQVQQSIWFAERDVQARHEKKSIFSYGDTFKNNFLLSSYQQIDADLIDILLKQGFETVKLKVGRDLKEEAQALNRFEGVPLKIRLDFNGMATESSFRKFLGELSSAVLSSIEYVEDPFSYDPANWQDVNELVPLAMDQQVSQVRWSELKAAPFSVLVVKPAKYNVEDLMPFVEKLNLKLTITSNMDHPVGVAHAAAFAAELKKSEGARILDAGCLTHHLYQADSFSNLMTHTGPVLNPVPGTGVGFDQLLAEVPWQPLVRL